MPGFTIADVEHAIEDALEVTDRALPANADLNGHGEDRRMMRAQCFAVVLGHLLANPLAGA